MTPDELLASLRGRLPALDAIVAGHGDPLDLPVALLPEVSDARAREVARAAARHPDVAVSADVDGAPPELRAARLDVVAALAGLARWLDDPLPWQDCVDEVRYDLLARPHAYRDLSDHALLLAESLDLTEESPHGSLLRLAARAALDAVGLEQREAAQRAVLRARRSARARRWRLWLGDRPVPDAFVQAIDHLEHNTLPLTTAEDSPDVMVRIRLGKALDGDVSLAVVPAGVVIEWDGGGAPPERATTPAGDLGLVERASLARRAWRLPAPSGDAVEVTLTRGDHVATIRWATG